VTSTQQHMHRIAREGVIGLVGAAVSAVAAFLLVVVVTNLFPPHVAGRFFTVMSAFLILLPVATLGTDVGLGRFLLRFVAHGRSGDIPSVIRAAFFPVLASTVVVSLAAFALADALADALKLEDGATPLRILAVALPFAVTAEVSLAGTRAFGRMRATVLVDKFGRSVAQTVLVAMSALAAGSLAMLTAAWAVPYVGTALIAGLIFRRFVRSRVAAKPADTTHTSTRTPYRQVRREFWGFTWPRGITGLAQIAVQRADIVLIAILRSPTEAAIYTAATRFVVLGQFGNSAIQQVVQPRFTALLATGETRSLSQVFRMSTAWSMAVSWPLYVLVGSLPLVYLGLFGSGYRETGVQVVVVMMFAMMLSASSGPADTLLLMSGHSKTSMANALVVVAIDVGLCLVLVPRLGILGAAVAWACAIAVRCTLTITQLRLYLDVGPWSRAMAIVVVAVLACLMLPLGLFSVFGDPSLLTGVLAGLLALAVYLAVLISRRDVLWLDTLGVGTHRRPSGGRDG
jgi:O-antigen/teichoic acid export membrane protein